MYYLYHNWIKKKIVITFADELFRVCIYVVSAIEKRVNWIPVETELLLKHSDTEYVLYGSIDLTTVSRMYVYKDLDDERYSINWILIDQHYASHTTGNERMAIAEYQLYCGFRIRILVHIELRRLRAYSTSQTYARYTL